MYGINKNVNESKIKCTFNTCNGIDEVKILANNTEMKIIPLYIRGVEWEKDFERTEQYYAEFNPLNTIVIGDLNVRIGEMKQDVDEMLKRCWPSYLGVRRSKDTVINGKGRKLLEFCCDYGLIVLNGVTKGDEEGNFTFVSTVGESVNDLCAVSQGLLNCVDNFQVEDKIWSDHMPICLTLKLKIQNGQNEKMNLLPKYQWKGNLVGQYNHKILNYLKAKKEEKGSLEILDITDIIKQSASQSKPKNSFSPNNKWFDWKCYNARKRSFELLSEYKHTKNGQIKQNYLNANKKFKIICKESKHKYFKGLELRLNQVNDSKSWWKIANEIRNQDPPELPNISATEFKTYFLTLLNPRQISNDLVYAAPYSTDVFLDADITVIEVQHALIKAKDKKAAGEDRIPYEFFKNAPHELITELTKIYNYQYSSSIVDDSFISSIIFPIHKKGDIDQPNNYRGISFMNCVAKILMGVITERLYNWVHQNEILTEYQSGFRKEYSTVDNIYNLTAIVHIKLHERKKVYAFFVDFKAAFDTVSRKSLVFKLFSLGVSTKMVRFIEQMYQNTYSKVWNGTELSEKFQTMSGVKQGCLLSPLLFSLYINDLHEYLGDGITIGNTNIRLLLYADDIVIMSEDAKKLQKMINNLEAYCNVWNLEVNLAKSKIMVFRKGGVLGRHEKWSYKNNEIEIVNEFCYLGMTLTPKLSFKKHVEKKNYAARNCINSTWSNLLGKQDITLNTKNQLFHAICRSIQSYGAQIWGHSHFEEVDGLQKYFLKRVLKLPKFTPNYALMLESGAEDGHLFTLNLHIRYIKQTLFKYSETRLPHILSHILLEKNLCWAKNLNVLGQEYNIAWSPNMSYADWHGRQIALINNMKITNHQNRISRWAQTESFYKNVDPLKAELYFKYSSTSNNITWIFKARCDLISLNGSRFSRRAIKQCSLCNLKEIENLQHFIGKCPILNQFRWQYFQKLTIREEELVRILNGQYNNWSNLVKYIINALAYRKTLVDEFNYYNV